MDQISIIQPDDWHLHLRDGRALETTVPAASTGLWPRHYYAQPNATGHYCGGSRGLQRAYSGPAPGGF